MMVLTVPGSALVLQGVHMIRWNTINAERCNTPKMWTTKTDSTQKCRLKNCPKIKVDIKEITVFHQRYWQTSTQNEGAKACLCRNLCTQSSIPKWDIVCLTYFDLPRLSHDFRWPAIFVFHGHKFIHMDEEDVLSVHYALHDPTKDHVFWSGKRWDIQEKKGIRYVTVFGHKFMQQNTNKDSEWTVHEQFKWIVPIFSQRKALQGHKITWVTSTQPWGRIVDDKIDQHCSLFPKNPVYTCMSLF